MSLDDQNRLRCITQAKKIIKNQISYLELLDGIFPMCTVDIPCFLLEKESNKIATNSWLIKGTVSNSLEIQRS